MIVFQEIVTTWTKASRGGEGAKARNGVPETFFLPDDWQEVPTVETFLHQRVHYTEYHNFTKPTITTEISLLPSDRWTYLNGGMALRLYPEGLAVQWRWTGDVGAPERNRYPRRVAMLVPGQWANLRFNGRMGYDNDWMYRKTIINVGVVGVYTPTIFLEPPTSALESMADLW
jgi:hypothetical protein